MKVTWDKGGEAEVVLLTMDKAEVLSDKPSPPGSRIEGAFASSVDAPAASAPGAAPRLRLKVHNCRREPDGRFRIEGRPLDLTKEVLVWVTSQGNATPAPKTE